MWKKKLMKIWHGRSAFNLFLSLHTVLGWRLEEYLVFDSFINYSSEGIVIEDSWYSVHVIQYPFLGKLHLLFWCFQLWVDVEDSYGSAQCPRGALSVLAGNFALFVVKLSGVDYCWRLMMIYTWSLEGYHYLHLEEGWRLQCSRSDDISVVLKAELLHYLTELQFQ